MSKTNAQRQREAIADNRCRVLGNRVICRTCGATLATFDATCSVSLDVICDGFIAIELADYPDGRNANGMATPEQLSRVRAIIAAPEAAA